MPSDSDSKASFLKELIREGKPSENKHGQKVLLIDRSGTAVAIISKLISKHAAEVEVDSATSADEEHFKPVGTMFILAMFVAALILLWASVYVILISRGVTV